MKSLSATAYRTVILLSTLSFNCACQPCELYLRNTDNAISLRDFVSSADGYVIKVIKILCSVRTEPFPKKEHAQARCVLGVVIHGRYGEDTEIAF